MSVLSPVRWFLTLHALERMADMGLTRVDVIAVLDQSEVTWTGTAYGDEQTVHVAGHLAVVTRADMVITVLWHTDEEYVRGQPHPMQR